MKCWKYANCNIFLSFVPKKCLNIPLELKEQVVALKEELKVSLSVIYNEAIANYIKQKELKKWQRGVDLALEDGEYMALTKELGSDNGDICEY
jgi:post-segregation antitoxin (ccd killing protein)